jgi:LuxR family maltose regulon positive regulatory protein
MAGGLIQTKLSVPRVRQTLVKRPHLLEKLDASVDGKLTLVSAPAGYGKTTLVANWLFQSANREMPRFCWLSLDVDDNDPAQFVTYLAGTLQSIDHALGQELSGLLHAQQGPEIQAFIAAMIDAIFRLDIEITIVLDDYHRIVSQPIHDALAFLLDHQPPQMLLLLLTREDPPLPLSRLRARGQLTEIRYGDLRFTRDDTAVFLLDVMGLTLSNDEITALEVRTEGWITGLQLAALSLRGRKDVGNFVESFTGSHRYVLDFLVDEVFLQQSAEMRDFLLDTAVLDRLTASLCNAVTGRNDSQEILLEAEQANLFFIPLDDSREWFRYHQLFADLLRERLRRTGRPVDLLHSRASEWYENQDFLREAIKHALAANELQRSALLIENISEDLLKRGQITTLLRWKQVLTDEVIFSQPRLCLDFAWALALARQVDAADHLLEPIAEVANNNPKLLSQVLILQAHIARTRHDIPHTIALSEQALSLLPPDEVNARAMVGINLGVAHMYNGDLAKAEILWTEAAQKSLEAENHHAMVIAMGFVGQAQAINGNLREAAATQRRAIQIGVENQALPTTGRAHVNLAALLYEWNDLGTAAYYLEQARKFSKRTGDIAVEWDACRVLANVRQAQGNQLEALEAIELANDAARKGDAPPNVHLVNSLTYLQLAIKEKDLAHAEFLSNQMNEFAPCLTSCRIDLLVNAGSLLSIPGLAWARLLLLQGKQQEASDLLAVCYETAVATGIPNDQINVRVWQTRAAADEDRALEFLAEAIIRAQSEGYIRTFLEAGKVLIPLLNNDNVFKIAPDYVMELLESFSSEQGKRQPILAPQPLVEPLSERELEILNLLAERQTNAEIAQAITVSINTVKTHLQHIYDKLGVHDRRTAVIKAVDLNLLQQ